MSKDKQEAEQALIRNARNIGALARLETVNGPVYMLDVENRHGETAVVFFATVDRDGYQVARVSALHLDQFGKSFSSSSGPGMMGDSLEELVRGIVVSLW